MTDDLPEIEVRHLNAEDAADFRGNHIRIDADARRGGSAEYTVRGGTYGGLMVPGPLTTHETLDDAVESVANGMARHGGDYTILVVDGAQPA